MTIAFVLGNLLDVCQQVRSNKVTCLTGVILQIVTVALLSAHAWYSLDFKGTSCYPLLALVLTATLAQGKSLK